MRSRRGPALFVAFVSAEPSWLKTVGEDRPALKVVVCFVNAKPSWSSPLRGLRVGGAIVVENRRRGSSGTEGRRVLRECEAVVVQTSSWPSRRRSHRGENRRRGSSVTKGSCAS